MKQPTPVTDESTGQKDIYGAPLTRPTVDILHGQSKRSKQKRCLKHTGLLTWIRVLIVDASVGHIVSSLNAPKVFELGFSPLGTYIITWQQASKDEKGDAVKNLKVWSVLGVVNKNSEEKNEEDIVGRFVQKSQTNWNLQYTHDEKYCARSVTNEIQFYESEDLSQVWNKLRVEGVSDFAIAPGSTNCIATFTPTQKVGLQLGVMKGSADVFLRANLLP